MSLSSMKVAVLFSLVMVSLTACHLLLNPIRPGGDFNESAPEIQSAVCTPLLKAAGDGGTLVVEATDKDGDELSYSYGFVDGNGSITGEGDEVDVTIDNDGDNAVEVTVTDKRGGVTRQTVDLMLPEISWYDNAWSYRKLLRVDGPVAGYQMRLTVYQNDGYDDPAAAAVDCGGNCNADFSDIRFVGLEGTEYDYWIENKMDGDHAVVWVNAPAEELICLYYGNGAAIDNSDGSAVWDYFEFWDSDHTGGYTHITNPSQPNRHSARLKNMAQALDISQGVRVLQCLAPTTITWNNYPVRVYAGFTGTEEDNNAAVDYASFWFYGDGGGLTGANEIEVRFRSCKGGTAVNGAVEVHSFSIDQFRVFEFFGNTDRLRARMYAGNTAATVLYDTEVTSNIPAVLPYVNLGSMHGSDDPGDDDFWGYDAGNQAVRWGAYNSGRSTLKLLSHWTCIGQYREPEPSWGYIYGQEQR